MSRILGDADEPSAALRNVAQITTVAGKSPQPRATKSVGAPENTTRQQQKEKCRKFNKRPETAPVANDISSFKRYILQDLSTVMEGDTVADYNEALELLKNNPPERVVDVRLPYSEFLQLDQETDISEDQRYPYLAYNSPAEIATVVTDPNSVHEVVVYEISHAIETAVDTFLSNHCPQLLPWIRPAGSTTISNFRGRYQRSRKQPDGGFFVAYPNMSSRLKIVVEVGFSESYAKHCRDKDLWLEGYGVNAVIFFRLHESPRFRYPRTPFDKVIDARTAVARMEAFVSEEWQKNYSELYFGPLYYRDHMWIWRTGEEPVKQDVILSGRICDPIPTTLGLKISDLGPHDLLAMVLDKEIEFDAKLLSQRVMCAMRDVGIARFAQYVAT
ncbi:hypothetical protein V1509DRAFT_654010 [Lipomyces kononenkoae]